MADRWNAWRELLCRPANYTARKSYIHRLIIENSDFSKQKKKDIFIPVTGSFVASDFGYLNNTW
jgi:hypothetical protein